MEKKKFIIIISVAVVLLALFGALYYYQVQKTGKLGAGNTIQDVQSNLEQQKQAVIDQIREKFAAERKKIQESSMSAEEKSKALIKIDQDMAAEIMAAVDKLNKEADKKLAVLRAEQVAAEEKAKKAVGETTFATEAESGRISQIFAAIKIDDAEMALARDGHQAVIDFLALEKFYKDDLSAAEKLIMGEISKIKPVLSLPGSYFEVPIE